MPTYFKMSTYFEGSNQNIVVRMKGQSFYIAAKSLRVILGIRYCGDLVDKSSSLNEL